MVVSRFGLSSLRASLLALVMLALLPAFVLLLHTAGEQRRVRTEETRADALLFAQHASGQEATLIDGTRQLLLTLARLAQVRVGDGVPCSALMADLLARNPTYANLGAARADGELFCSGVAVVGAVSAADRPWFREAMRTGGFAIGPYQISRVTGRATVELGYPVRDDGGQVLSVVMAELDLAALAHSADEAGLPPGATLTLIDPAGLVLARAPDATGWLGQIAPEAAAIATLDPARAGVIEAADATGERRLFAVMPLRGQAAVGAVRAVVSVPLAAIHAEADRLLALNLAWLGVVAVLAVVAAWIGGDMLVLRRVRAILAATRRLAAGDLGARVGGAGGGELGQLAGAFDEMALALGAQAARLRAGEVRYRAVVDTASDAIVTMDAAGIIRSFNRGAERIFGHTAAEAIGQPLTLLMPARFRAGQDAGLARHLGGDEPRVVGRSLELSGLRRDGSEFPLEVSIGAVRLEDERLFTGIMRDITVRKALEEQLTHQAFHDPVTGLANRALFRERVGHALARAARRGERTAVLFLDLDGFKKVNDSLGHGAGDRLLVAIAERLARHVRTADTVARLGGDEFAALLEELPAVPEVAEAEAGAVADRLLAALREPVMLDGAEVVVGASVGVALAEPAWTGGPADVEEVLRRADIAMYAAKRRGKGRTERFDPALAAVTGQRLVLEADLRHALERGEIEVHYQPTVDLASGRLAGLEALARWRHPERGLVSPALFIPLAEETGLILPLGGWVLRAACRQAALWGAAFPAEPPLTVAVNLSARQLQDPDLAAQVAAALGDAGLPADRLTLEITESVMMEDAEASITALTALKGLGVRLAVDDFGTGYSSLSYLQRFPLDVLKIDRAFVGEVETGGEGAALARTVVELGRTLGLRTVAEGIEGAGQAARLRALGCDLGQGYLFARPLPPAEVEQILAAGRLPSAPALVGHAAD